MRLSSVLLLGVMLSLGAALFLGFWGAPFPVVQYFGFLLGGVCLFLTRLALLVSPAEFERERRAAPELHRLVLGVLPHVVCAPLLSVAVVVMVWRGSWEVGFLLLFVLPLYALAVACQVRESREAPLLGPGPMVVGWGAPVVPPPGWSVLSLGFPTQRKSGLNRLNPRFQVDGESVVSLAAGQWATVALPPGRHRVRAVMSLQRSAPLEVVLRPGESAHVDLSYRPLPAGSEWWRTLELSRADVNDPRRYVPRV
ncbi:hypothetical protein ABZ635_14610 [Nocardiopsis sp. NPDC007018]|uniref:hypothetical protein n=1 Tax=Nocardiopsis sp. NPDC007018 TaxID=3155721 RepID=UPI0033FB0094